MPKLQGYSSEGTTTLLHLYLKTLEVVCQFPKAIWCLISQAILVMIPVTGNPAIDTAGPEENVPVPELRNQFEVPSCYKFALEFF
jgi:hypothetical protein